ncbi:putative De-etiolated protein 1 Det1 [Trypoxylus dichotomus]
MDSFIKPRKVPPQNIVLRLFHRQIFGNKKPGTHFHTARQFYQNIFPNFTLINVEKPPCFLRKFSPDGPAAAGDLLQNVRTKNEKQKFEIKSKIFDRFFQLKFVVNVSQSLEQLNRECSLFSDDGKYVIIGSATFIPEELRPHFYEIYTNNESVTPNPRSPLEDYSLHLVDLHAGKLCDTRQFKLLDENHILIKYASEEVVTLKSPDANSQPSFFVVYNMSESKILAIYENTSKELLNLFENFCDSFRNASIYNETQFTCSPSNNIYARLIQHRFKQTIVSAKFGGKTEATKRLLAQLPISAQSYSSSPYLDLSLFSYDDKWVSVMERPKPCGEHPIRFYARDSGYLKFRIYAGGTNRSQPQATRRLVAFTFHPTDPFAISVQRTNSEYIVNFHIRFDHAEASFEEYNNILK